MRHTTVLILKIALFFQILGHSWYTFTNRSAVFKFLWINLGFTEKNAILLENTCLLAVFISAFFLFFKNHILPTGVILCYFLLDAVLLNVLGGSFASRFSPFAQSARILLPLCLYCSYATRQKSLREFYLVGKVALGVTFVVHGLEALFFNPTFVDYILNFSRRFLQLPLSETVAENTLIIIGIVDILVGVCVFFKMSRGLLYYLAFWGFITALARVFYSFEYGWPQFLLRSAHFAIPIAIATTYYVIQNKQRDVLAS